MSLLLLLRDGEGPSPGAAITAEVLEAADVLDSLVREPEAELLGKKWHGIWAGTGNGTPTGWTHGEGEEFSTARWWSYGFPGPAFVGLTFAVSLGVGQEFKFMLLDDKVGNCVELKFIYNTSEQYFWALIEEDAAEAETVLDSGFVPRVDGDRFWLSAEEGTGGIQAWRQPEGEAPEPFGQGTLAIPFTSLGKTADIKLYQAGAFRATDFAAGSTNPDPPIEEKAAGPTLLALNYANWGPAEDAVLAEAVKLTRFDAELGAEALEAVKAAGMKFHMLFPGPYDEGGVSAIDPDKWVEDALAFYESNVTPEEAPIVEVLNEPGGWWFWGEAANDPVNTTAYRTLVQKTYEAFHAKYGDAAPKIVANVEGNGLQFGEQWWLPECAAFCDGVVVHPYGGTGVKAESALGNRARVEEARELTGMPIYVTEVGWPTALEAAPTGDSLQWTEDEQAANIKSFLSWARGTRYVAEVVIYTFHDFGTQTWYGVVRLDGSHKPAYDVLKAAVFPFPRIAVTRESPPDRMEFIVRAGPGGPPIARWAEDAVRDEDVLGNISLRGQVPGGRKEAIGTLPRDPRQPAPDTRPFADVDVQGAGGELLWSGRFSKAPQSDGDTVSIDGVCVGWQNALSDRKGVQVGLIDSSLGRVGDITAQRRRDLLDANIDPSAVGTSADPYGSGDEGSLPAGLTFAYQRLRPAATVQDRGEMMLDSGGPGIGAAYYDFEGRPSSLDADFFNRVDLSKDGVSTHVAGTDHNTVTALGQATLAGGTDGLRYVIFTSAYDGSGEVDPRLENFRFSHIVVLGDHGLVPVGTWPNIGLTKAQIFPWLIPQIAPALEVSADSIDDDNWVIQDAWYPDAGQGADIVHDLMKTSVLDWFVRRRRLFEVRVPGTYGRRWKATIANSEFQEDGIDSERSWRSIKGSYTDEAGVTRYVGPPGSGADTESPLLEITDPNHPAVQADIPREDLLQLQKVSTPARAVEACAEWLKHANELPRSGRAVLRDHVMDEFAVMRPVSQVGEGDPIQFTDSGDNSYRKIIDYDYSRGERACSISVDAPSDALQALNERYGAVLTPLGL